ncbi:MAG: Calx-beta domain-containing protein [Thermoanaerobaculia bacterium]
MPATLLILAIFVAAAAHGQTLTIGDATVVEGDSGTTAAVFDVTLTGVTPQTVQVSFATEDGTATVADGDYLATGGVLAFGQPGTQQVVVEVFGDTREEGFDVFFVTLSNAVNATIIDGEGQGTIINDDVSNLAITDVSVSEGDSGTVNAVFSLTLSAPSAFTVGVGYATRDGTATAGADYATGAGTLIFPPGQTQRTIVVEVIGDTLIEGDETFFVDASILDIAAFVGPVTGLGTIVDDDAASLSIGDATVTEGDSGTVEAVFDVTLSSVAAMAVTASFATTDGTAVAGVDYAAAAGTLTFAAGETLRTVTVEVFGDTLVEGDETFFVDLSAAAGAVIADGEGIGSIVDDDAAGLSIGDVTVTEGDSGTVQAAFEVVLSPAAVQAVTVDFATRDGSAGAGADYTPSSGTLTFAPGETLQTVTVAVLGDGVVEGDETFFVDLSTADGAEITDGEGMGTIVDDDMASFSIGDVTVTEGDAGTVDAVFDVTLSSPASQPLTVDFATADGSATAGADYTPSSGTLTFPPGVTARTVTVAVLGDVAVEADETFFVDLANPSGGTSLGDGRGQGTVLDDDEEASRIRFARVPATMENAGIALVTVERLGGAGSATRVTVRAVSGTAVDGEDFTAAAQALQWAAGELGARVFEIEILDDILEEADETILVELLNPVDSVLAGPSRRELTLLDDDMPMALAAVGEAELTAAVGDEIELRVRAARDDGAPVAGAAVAWSVEGEAELRDGELTTTGDEGVAVQRLGLGSRPGEVTVVARIEGLDVSVTFRITVEGNLGDRVDSGQDPAAAAVADALDQACAGASGELGDLCDYLFSLDGPDQGEALAELTPKEVSAQGTIALESQRTQLRNLAARMAAVRRGARNQGAGQLAVTVRGTGLDVGGLIAAIRGSSAVPMAHQIPAVSFTDPSREPEYWLDSGAGALSEVRFAQDDGSSADTGALDEPTDGGSRLGFFVNGQLSFGDRPSVAGETGFDFETAGLTAGVDYLVSDRFFLGGAVGYLDADTDLAAGAGKLDVRGYSLSLYASYYLAHFYVDGILGYGTQEYDTARNIDLPQPFLGRDRFAAVASPDGDQLSLSLGAGYDADLGAWSVGGFGRLSRVDADIDAYAETGAGAFNLAFGEQTAKSLLAEAGIEVTYAASMSWGVLLPTVRLAALHEFDDDLRLIRARFVEDPSGIDFVVPTTTPDRDFLNLSAGVTATLPRGRTLFLLYDTDLGRDDLDVATITVGLRLEL